MLRAIFCLISFILYWIRPSDFVPLIPISIYDSDGSKLYYVLSLHYSKNNRIPLYFPYLKSAISNSTSAIFLFSIYLFKVTARNEFFSLMGMPVSESTSITVFIYIFSSKFTISISFDNIWYYVFADFDPLDHSILTSSSYLSSFWFCSSIIFNFKVLIWISIMISC